MVWVPWEDIRRSPKEAGSRDPEGGAGVGVSH